MAAACTRSKPPGHKGTGQALTFVPGEVDTLKLIKATGVCRDEWSEVGVHWAQQWVSLKHKGELLGSPLLLPIPSVPQLTFITGGFIRAVRAVRGIITLQEAVDTAAIAAAELRGVAAARAHWMGG